MEPPLKKRKLNAPELPYEIWLEIAFLSLRGLWDAKQFATLRLVAKNHPLSLIVPLLVSKAGARLEEKVVTISSKIVEGRGPSATAYLQHTTPQIAKICRSAFVSQFNGYFVTCHTALLQTISFLMASKKYCSCKNGQHKSSTTICEDGTSWRSTTICEDGTSWRRLDVRTNFPNYTRVEMSPLSELSGSIIIRWWKPRSTSHRFIMLLYVDKSLTWIAALEDPLRDILTQLEIDAIFVDMKNIPNTNRIDEIIKCVPESPLYFTGNFANETWNAFKQKKVRSYDLRPKRQKRFR